jgi:hypothetical protein
MEGRRVGRVGGRIEGLFVMSRGCRVRGSERRRSRMSGNGRGRAVLLQLLLDAAHRHPLAGSSPRERRRREGIDRGREERSEGRQSRCCDS